MQTWAGQNHFLLRIVTGADPSFFVGKNQTVNGGLNLISINLYIKYSINILIYIKH